MRRTLRFVGTVLAVGGSLALIWAMVVWRWQDPLTALYTKWKQHGLAAQYARGAAAFRAQTLAGVSFATNQRGIATEARRYRLETHRGEAIGRIVVPRLGLNMILVDGTDHDSLTKGP